MEKPYILFRFVPTMRCNYRCNYCFVPLEEKSTRQTIFDEFKPADWVAAMAKWKDYEVEFYCWGGEPFILSGTYEIVRGWTQYDHVIDGNRLDTNMFFTDKIASNSPSAKIKLNCSWHTQYDSLDRIYAKVKKLNDLNMIGMVNFVASELNLKTLANQYNLDLDGLIHKFEDIGVFLNVAGDFHLLEELNGEDYQQYKALLLRYLNPEDWKQLRCEKGPSQCEANAHFFTVYPNGDLKPCLSGNTVGNFFEGTIQFPDCTVCHESCPSLVAYPFRKDNPFPYRRHIVEYANRNRLYRQETMKKAYSSVVISMPGHDAEAPVSVTQPAVLPVELKSPAVKCSIVLPTYNHLQFLPQAIRSIQEQSFQDYELIIVNDGSTDGTQEYLDQLNDPKIRVIHQKNQKLPGALNTGFRAARGELLTWISADNYCAPFFLEAFVKAFETHPEAGFACSAFACIDETDRVIVTERQQELNPYGILTKIDFGIASFMYRKSCQDTVGLYDPDLEGAEDWDMWLRILEKFTPVYVPEILYYYRRHSNSMTGQKMRQIENATTVVFNNAVSRRNLHPDRIEELYPAILYCQDQIKARFHACLDFGTRLLKAYFARPDLACQYLRTAVSLNPFSSEAVAHLALALVRTGGWSEARAWLASIKDDRDPRVQRLIFEIESAMDLEDPGALIHCHFLQIDPSLSDLFKAGNDRRKVFSWAARGEKDDPNPGQAPYAIPDGSGIDPCFPSQLRIGAMPAEELAELTAQILSTADRLFSDDQRQGAMNALERGLSIAPSDNRFVITYANLLLQQGDLSRAMGLFSQATVNDPTDPNGFANVAGVYYFLGLINIAREFALQSLALDPDRQDSQKICAWVAQANGDLEQATLFFSNIRRLNPEDLDAKQFFSEHATDE